jgi:ArsR family transcriptional regulator
MHALPFADASFDQVTMLNVLVHSKSPGKAVAEAARVLAPGGDFVAVGLDAHEHADAARAWGHAQRGIAPAALRRFAQRAGLSVLRCEVVTRERPAPHFGVVALFARKET